MSTTPIAPSETRDLLLEIGTEELPASEILPALDEMKKLFAEKAAAARLTHGLIATYGTPRRLALVVQSVASLQASLTEEILGPPARVAFDADGKPTQVAEKWARSQGVDVSALEKKQTSKGEYSFLTRNEAGRPAADILPDLFQSIVTSIHFRKSMRWGWQTQAFSRPVQWICALFGNDVLAFDFADVKSGGTSRGHRFVSPGEIEIGHPSNYLSKLEAAHVIADLDRRRSMIAKLAQAAATEVNGSIRNDPELLDTVTCLVEHPTAVLGSFEKDFLDLPPEVLVSEAREHQKYFSVVDQHGHLMPHFVAISNTPIPDVSIARVGYERVLRARLSDARFFFDDDRKKPLESRVDELKRVVFQQKLGTSFEKMERFRSLARFLAEEIGLSSKDALDQLARAATLCKADLVTGMVGEFPELQGVMGREYALAEGESLEVADAIFEHYLPRFSGDVLPSHDAGALIGLADRLDTLAGILGIGKGPTGAADPFALRRACIGAIHITLSRGWRLSLTRSIARAVELLGERLPNPERTKADLFDFFRERLRNLWADEHRRDVIDAVLSAGFDDLVDARDRLIAVSHAVKEPSFEALAGGFKRAVNILEKQAKGIELRPVDPALLTDMAEKQLFEAISTTRGHIETAVEMHDYASALGHIATLRGPIDRFFDEVRVMADDPAVKTNRLSLLADVRSLFVKIADFSRIQAQG
ncbi:MAG: glycine--tRNA ligase subunit beta [Myxococcales bacterium]|jgi:glycyl-tRNA synthetase beta chain|nr:glycine--tRNA ligase subunit beta [Myxococcales bacterium]